MIVRYYALFFILFYPLSRSKKLSRTFGLPCFKRSLCSTAKTKVSEVPRISGDSQSFSTYSFIGPEGSDGS